MRKSIQKFHGLARLAARVYFFSNDVHSLFLFPSLRILVLTTPSIPWPTILKHVRN